MHSSIGQNIKSFGVSGFWCRCPVCGLRCPVSVDNIVTLFMDRSLPNLEHSFYVRCTNKIFWDWPLLPSRAYLEGAAGAAPHSRKKFLLCLSGS